MNRALIAGILLILGSCFTQAESDGYGSARVTEITSIYDGDTFRANIEGWPPVVGERIPIRIKGVDTPELRGKCRTETLAARKAKQFTVASLRGAESIMLHNIERGKYFRLVADVIIDGESLGEQLIANGLAVLYASGRKPNWCINEAARTSQRG